MMDAAPEEKPVMKFKKSKRLENRKRKIRAFLSLVDQGSDPPAKQAKPSEEDDEDYAMEVNKFSDSCKFSSKAALFEEAELQSLKKQLISYKKKQRLPEPTLSLTDYGQKAKIRLQEYEPGKATPLCTRDVLYFLLKGLLGNTSPYSPQWAKLSNPSRIPGVLVVVVEGLPKQSLISNVSLLKNTEEIFSGNILETLSSSTPFATELSMMDLVTDYHIHTMQNGHQPYSSLFPVEKKSKEDVEKNAEEDVPEEACSKLHLLLSPVQLIMENYPVPKSVFDCCKSEGYCFTKKEYTHVTPDSPMFALDCEMCKTETGDNELTRIAVVNEALETVYTTLVKPKAKIVDYLTKYSGITEKMLKDVTTTLKDVQMELQTIFPSDAILCGQSLNCDLHALKLIHPYIIDTSVIYNTSGIPHKKDSLKKLTKIHLKESIQNDKDGHNPIEDSLATMKLVLLKLKNTLKFGDAFLNKGNEKSETKPAQCPNPTLVGGDTYKKFFYHLKKANKKICILTTPELITQYSPDSAKDAWKVIKSPKKKLVNATIDNVKNFNLTLSHLNYSTDTADSVSTFDAHVRQLYNACPENSLFVVFVSGFSAAKFEDVRSNLCMAALKAPVKKSKA